VSLKSLGLTERDKARRRKHITATDAPKICGWNPWEGPRDVWTEKCLLLQPDKPTIPQQLGLAMEPFLLAYGADRLGVRIRRNCFRVAKHNALFSCTYDALIPDRPHEAMQAKTQGITTPGFELLEPWPDEEDSQQLPAYVVGQAQWEMMVGGLSVDHIPAFIAGKGWKMYRIGS